MVKKVGPRLRELAPLTSGYHDARSRNLGLPFWPSLYSYRGAQNYGLKGFIVALLRRFTHDIVTARMTCLLSRGVLNRLDMFFLLPSAWAFWYWAFAMVCLKDKVSIKSPWTVVGFSQIIYCLCDYQRLCKQLPKLINLRKIYSMLSCLMNVY